MNSEVLNDKYFEWMYRLVCNDRYNDDLSYRKLLSFLHNTEFIYIIEQDSNRAVDGIDFRYRFGYERNYKKDTIAKYLDIRNCSVLEMMISLAFRTEEQIMDDPNLGNRTGQWFWNMIVNLGLGNMCDTRFNKKRAEIIIFDFLNRKYKPNGKGGLFTLDNPKYDLKTVEIWFQMMWYLDENFDFSI